MVNNYHLSQINDNLKITIMILTTTISIYSWLNNDHTI